MHMGHLARAFGIGEEYLRRLRRLEETQGLGAVLKVATGCTKRAPNDEESGAVIALRSRPVAGGHLVQHLGTWLLMALAYRDGLHDVAAKLGGRYQVVLERSRFDSASDQAR